MANPKVEVNDQEETVLSTAARAAELADAVKEAKSQIEAKEAKSSQRRKWLVIAAVAVVILAGAVVTLL